MGRTVILSCETTSRTNLQSDKSKDIPVIFGNSISEIRFNF
jgi:hypothetical protein